MVQKLSYTSAILDIGCGGRWQLECSDDRSPLGTRSNASSELCCGDAFPPHAHPFLARLTFAKRIAFAENGVGTAPDTPTFASKPRSQASCVGLCPLAPPPSATTKANPYVFGKKPQEATQALQHTQGKQRAHDGSDSTLKGALAGWTGHYHKEGQSAGGAAAMRKLRKPLANTWTNTWTTTGINRYQKGLNGMTPYEYAQALLKAQGD